MGYLHLYSYSTSSALVDEITSGILSTFDEISDDFEFHAMMCFVRLSEIVDELTAERLIPKLKRGMHLVIGMSPEQWQLYCGKLLSFEEPVRR